MFTYASALQNHDSLESWPSGNLRLGTGPLLGHALRAAVMCSIVPIMLDLQTDSHARSHARSHSMIIIASLCTQSRVYAFTGAFA